MADIKYDFAADVTAAERAIARLEQKVDKLENANKQLHRTSKRGADQSQAGFSRMVTGAAQAAAGWLSIGAAVSATTRLLSQFNQEVEESRKRSEKFHSTLFQELALTGDLAAAPLLKTFFQSQATATESQAAAAFAGVKAGGPRLDLARAKELSREVSKISVLLTKFDAEGQPTDVSGVGKFGQLAAKFEEFAPGKSAQDIIDLTLSAHQRAGDKIEQLASGGTQRLISYLTKEGLSPERAISVALESLEEDVEAGSLIAGFTKAKAKGVGAMELLTDPQKRDAVLEAEQKTAFGLLSLRDIAQQERGLTADQANDLQRQQLLAGFRADPTRFSQQQTAIGNERNLRHTAEQEREADAARARYAEEATSQFDRFVTTYVENPASDLFENFSRLSTPAASGPPVSTEDFFNLGKEQRGELIDLQKENNRLLGEVAKNIGQRPQQGRVNRGAQVE